ncbi:Transferase caf17 protein [Thalictrum thalictroides]|uniref:Transferase caf17 protein n=1 Tax=Thalictrum thalictroides TaxID=46969 RepID=A0A7J6VVB7_THATH|nr:Transferase caf17 protein [Thalictrum thalictroides]
MDSSLTKQKPVKLLSELLQEQQEPFCLDVYLLERGYPKGRNGFGNSSKELSTLNSHGLKRRKKIPPCPKILKTVLNKLVSNNILVSCKDELKTSSFDASEKTNNVSVKGKRNHHHVAELDRFSSASSMTICDSSCSESDIEDEFSSPVVQQNQLSSSCTDASQIFKLCQLRHQGNGTQQCGCLEESKQHSPVSVLEELPSDEVSPFHNHMKCCSRSNRKDTSSTSGFNQSKRVTEDSILSASLWDLLAHSSVDKQGNVGVKELRKLLDTASTSSSSSSSSQYKKTKKVLEQTKQLLFDCVREVLESHARNEERNKLFGAEQVGKIICEQICVWAKQSGNVKNITQLIQSDFGKSLKEWNDYQPKIMKIGIEVSNAIMEDMENEIVLDIIENCSKH